MKLEKKKGKLWDDIFFLHTTHKHPTQKKLYWLLCTVKRYYILIGYGYVCKWSSGTWCANLIDTLL